MKQENAQIIIDVVMGELQKKDMFSSSLSRVAEKAIKNGIQNASKVDATALNKAIIRKAYSETPASKAAIKKLARAAMTISSKEIERYNTSQKGKGGFLNFMGSLAVNTGFLRFGQGYKGKNFFRDRYQDKVSSMDSKGQKTDSYRSNFGRIGGDLFSIVGAFVSAAKMLSEAVSKGLERIQPMIDEGINNMKEITSIASSIGYKGKDLRPIIAPLNVIDAYMAGTNQKNLGSQLVTAFGKKDQIELARKAGFSGVTALDLAGEFFESLRTDRKMIMGEDGNAYSVAMTKEELDARNKITFTMNSPSAITEIKRQLGGTKGPTMAFNGGTLDGQETEAQRVMKSYKGPLTAENYSLYREQQIGAQFKKLHSESSILMGPSSAKNLTKLGELEANRIDRLVEMFEHFEEIVTASITNEIAVEKITDSISLGATKIVNAVTGKTPGDTTGSKKSVPLRNTFMDYPTANYTNNYKDK